MLRKVYLEGEIAEKFGHEFEMNVSSFGEALQCFEVNFSNFREYVMECDNRGIGFICSVEDDYIQDERQLLLQYPKGDMVISAVPAGSKKGLGKILAGVALIALAIYAPQLMAASAASGSTVGMAVAGFAMAAAPVLIGIGVNLALTGLQEMMAPDPSVDIQQDESYLFQGSSHNIIEGDPVPILYGKLRIPGRPISFEIKNEGRSFTDYAQLGVDTPTPGIQNDGPDHDRGPTRDGR